MVRKFISLFLTILLVVNIMPIGSVFAEADITAPVLVSVTVDKKEAVSGDYIRVSVKATDDVAIQYVSAYYKKPITGNSLSLSLYYNSARDAYEGTIPINSSSEAGTYNLYSISITDTSYNSTSISTYNDPEIQLPAGSFTVSGTNADVTKPVLESISIDRKEAIPGDYVRVSVKATDDVAIQYVSAYYKKPITGNSLSLSLYYNSARDAYEGTIPINSSSEAGTYNLYSISITDTSYNSTSISTYNDPEIQLPAGSFTVSGTKADVTKPVLESISIDRKEAIPGDYVRVSVKATDDVAIQYVSAYYKKPITGNSLSLSLYYNSARDAYEGTIPINSSSEAGTYNLYSISITDTSYNSTSISTYNDPEIQLPAGSFTVYTENNPPLFNNLSVDKTTVDSGDIITFTIKATDDTNLQSAKVNLISPISKTKHTVNLSYYNSEFIGKLSINSNSEVGKWIVDSVEITDTNANTLKVNAVEADLTTGEFNVLQSISPIDSYAVTSNETWSNKTVNNDVYIAPGSVLTISSNVTITGNVYVLGGLKVNGGLTVNGSLYANYMTFGYYYPSDGQAILSGSNSVSSIKVSNRILTEVPFKLYDAPLVSKNGKVNVTGATLPFVNVSVNGQELTLKSNGSFRLDDFAAGENIEFTVTDPYGYEYSYSYSVAEIYVDELTKLSTEATGKTHPNSLVKIKNTGNLVGSGKSDEEGKFYIPVSNLIENSNLTFEVYDFQNILTASKEVIVKDLTAPEQPVIDEFADNSTAITGKAEADSTVYVKNGTDIMAQGKADSTGGFNFGIKNQKAGTELIVYAQDPSGNKSNEVKMTVLDKTAPEKPSVNEVTSLSQSITGNAEPGTTITVTADGVVLDTTTADSAGNFTIAINQQKAGTILEITTADIAGNSSAAISVTVTNSFTDVLQNQRFQEEIKFLSDKNIITGFPDGTFRPSDTVTRAQAAIMIGRALGLEGTQRETTFKDVHQSQVASGFIASAVEKGIIAGFPDNSYRPNEPVTRGQMAIFIARAFDLKEESESSFSDVPASSAAYVYIKRILAESITTGYPDGTFKPSKELIRSDFSAFMARALDDRFKISQ
ncbi:S-layer homology domain-containing protein [Bacillus sp. ISL-41]|uniref:Ig-like domain-containing protein n=1 Tax=Bacillus sp. ISL-41 TaxID=2819127 RepID=UPI001BEC44E9|nr:Ig-like domain-containing protein [Bacillus sp. ISL-41]MBT2643632.1 S-layer homology domain-containing protein [Bacillus sp. ISL-41]